MNIGKFRIAMLRFRMSTHRLQVESGGWKTFQQFSTITDNVVFVDSSKTNFI